LSIDLDWRPGQTEKPSGKKRRTSDGKGLLLKVNPAEGKYWLWCRRYPPSKDGKQQ